MTDVEATAPVDAEATMAEVIAFKARAATSVDDASAIIAAALNFYGNARAQAVRQEALREAMAIAKRRTESPDCERAHYDGSCNVWECPLEIRGADCTCNVRIKWAEQIEADIRALLEPSP